MKFFPFRSLVPRSDTAAQVTSLGSGKMPLKWLQKRAQDNALSYLRVVKPEYIQPELEAGTDAYYAASKANFDALLNENALEEWPEGLCYYRQSKPDGSHYEGWIVGVTAEGYRNGRIVRHENTIKSKENRLVKYLQTLHAMAEPVLFTQKLPAAVLTLGKELGSGAPRLHYTDAQGLVHELFPLPCTDPRCQQVLESLMQLPKVYIADGHHRVAACSTFLEGQEDQGFMALLLDDEELAIKSFHRVFTDPSWTQTLEQFQADLEALGLNPKPCVMEGLVIQHGECVLMHREGTLRVQLLKPESTQADELLDVHQAEIQVLKPLFDVQDSSHDARMSFMRGDTPMSELQKQLNEGCIQMAMVLAPCSIDEVKQVGDQGLIMPPKSTWIEPKMQTGMITQLF